MQSDFDIINKNINQFTTEMEVIEKDIKDIVSNFVCLFIIHTCICLYVCIRCRKIVYII